MHGALLIVSILLISKSESGVFDIISNNTNDKSICKQYHRVPFTRLVSYRETYAAYEDYDYPNIEHTRLNFRIENVTKWEAIEMCCEGYEPHLLTADAEKCVPICRSDCLNGMCLRPNECACNDGYVMKINKLTEYSECVPVCASGCYGGSCVAPNTCACHYGYQLAKDRESCEPTCTAVRDGGHHQGCGMNASCIGPDTCQCNDGYTAMANLTEMTIRDAQNTLRRFVSMKQELSLDHEPLFNTSQIICEPLCEPECGENSNCGAPNECHCNTGYGKGNYTNDHRCFPICEKICFNGFCESPNKCACLEGYKPHRVLNEDMCEPFCANECVNGKCSEPNRCECFDGYEKLILRTRDGQKISDNVCVPICSGRCQNGTCVSPGQCQCNAGYILEVLQLDGTRNNSGNTNFVQNGSESSDRSSQQICQPFCEPDCPKGSKCIAPNRCRSATKREPEDFNDFPKVLTKIVSSGEECDKDDYLYKENGTCVCKYRSDDRMCTRNALCAVIFTSAIEPEEKFIGLQSIVFLNSTSDEKYFDRWEDSKCTNKCRILINSDAQHHAIQDNAYHANKHCYALKMHNATTGLLSAINSEVPFFLLKEKHLTICSLKIEPLCSIMASKVTGSRVGTVVGGVFGAILLTGIIVGIIIMIYVIRRKGKTIGGFGGISASNGNMLDQTETMESPLHTADNSHL